VVVLTVVVAGGVCDVCGGIGDVWCRCRVFVLCLLLVLLVMLIVVLYC